MRSTYFKVFELQTFFNAFQYVEQSYKGKDFLRAFLHKNFIILSHKKSTIRNDVLHLFYVFSLK